MAVVVAVGLAVVDLPGVGDVELDGGEGALVVVVVGSAVVLVGAVLVVVLAFGAVVEVMGGLVVVVVDEVELVLVVGVQSPV